MVSPDRRRRSGSLYSVIIPAKNEIPHLWSTVHMIRQMWEHRPDEGGEIIVVDDGSTDYTQTFPGDWVTTATASFRICAG